MTQINTKEEYEWAVARVEELLKTLDKNIGGDNVLEEPKVQYGKNKPLEIELNLLSNLVADYSDSHYDVGKPTLTEMIELRLYERGMTRKSLADLLGVSQSRISEYMNGKCEPTLQIARKISKELDIDPSIVLGV